MSDQNSTAIVVPFNEIALALSGGGFRAASYSLGCLSYLAHVRYNGESLLSKVKFISSASGGSITNLYYSLKVSQDPQAPFKVIFEDLYNFMNGSDLIAHSFNALQDGKVWKNRPTKGRNLINAFAITYDQLFFKGAMLKELFNNSLHEVCINSTEFDYGISFRFQTGSGSMGNSKVRISEETAGFFKLGDILAASSCFPMGFEPIMMPFDFAHQHLSDAAIVAATTNRGEFGLMDGGITDNQGIHSFLLAEERKTRKDNKGFDLFMYCDVASQYMDGYQLPRENRSFFKAPPVQFYLNLFKSMPFVFVACLITLRYWAHPWWLISITTLAGLFALTYMVSLFILLQAKRKAERKRSTWAIILLRYLNGFLFTRTSAFLQMLSARVKSAGILVGDVYLKQIRRLTINSLYENEKSGKKWRLHAIGNFLHELSTVNNDRSRPRPDVNDVLSLEKGLIPSAQLVSCADQARAMDTTLWFDENHVRDNKREALIAAGQFTTCYNLIKYIGRLERQSITSPQLNELRSKLLIDWKKFNEAPLFMANPIEYDKHSGE